ncbi:DUF4385 domain-containing protein [Candidatus Paracaedibacter symbiosus]|uniref:DUF4385 domain-containing protein n=1 Tax=Candidatus Paracaedibacter symbiosus TaxID=244582 RepID=UPI000509548F|nr:DUF4385 domain-containing protein [Candidatus Paracaedibacter symbiosus]
MHWELKKSTYPWSSTIDYRKNPEKYQVGKGEQGVLICEPYKSEILPHWRFKNPEIAEKSAKEIFNLFKKYLNRKDFVGADMARKYLQMGYTRARRYANHKGGKKYDPLLGTELPLNVKDPDKEESARLFYRMWKKAESDFLYSKMKRSWKERYG